MVGLTTQWFSKDAKDTSEQMRMRGTEMFDKTNHVLKVTYTSKDGKNSMTMNDIKILATDFDSFIISYSRSLNSMWLFTMPIPD